MLQLNETVIVGNLSVDPRVNEFKPAGKSFNTYVGNLCVAWNDYFIDESDGKKEEWTNFIDVEIWGPDAYNIRGNGRKGDKVIVKGRIFLSKWVDKYTGKDREKFIVKAATVQLVKD